MSQRTEFVLLASQADVNFRRLCSRFKISRKTGYKWRSRYLAGGAMSLVDRSRQPKHSPLTVSGQLAEVVIKVRQEHPTWGGRKLKRRLQDLHQRNVPAASTCTAIVRRAGLLDPQKSAAHRPLQRFERSSPNELWQMDFKGHFGLQNGGRCHPLTAIDDYSRFNLVLQPAGNETGPTVRAALTEAFSLYGLPSAILCDNGPPWGTADQVCPYTSLTVWLLRLGVQILHGHPYHPQTQGKAERFHRTLLDELIALNTWRDLAHCAREFPRFRHCYNCERPHDSLEGNKPVSRYQPSPRTLPASLPSIDYHSSMRVQTVRPAGIITLKGQTWYVGRAFSGLPVGLRPSAQADGQWFVYFAHHLLGCFDLHTPRLPKHTLRSIYDSLPPTSLSSPLT